jgi:hypothetical protein
MSSASLVNEGLVVRYFLDNFTNDQFADSGPAPSFPLQAVDVGQEFMVGGESGHKGLHWTAVGANARVRAQFSAEGSKPASKMLLAGGELTIEVVLSVLLAGDRNGPSRIVFVGTATGEIGKFSLSAGEPDATGKREMQFYLSVGADSLFAGQWFVPRANLEEGCVMHLVLAAASQQVDLYVNGELLPNSLSDRPPREYTFSWMDPTWYFVLGNREGGGRSFRGALDYAAMYRKALSPDEVKNNAALLTQYDDGPAM